MIFRRSGRCAVARMALRIAVSVSSMRATPCSCCPVALMLLTDTAIRNAILATAHLPERRKIIHRFRGRHLAGDDGGVAFKAGHQRVAHHQKDDVGVRLVRVVKGKGLVEVLHCVPGPGLSVSGGGQTQDGVQVGVEFKTPYLYAILLYTMFQTFHAFCPSALPHFLYILQLPFHASQIVNTVKPI